jgi:molybdopterin synthase catalytic subunit
MVSLLALTEAPLDVGALAAAVGLEADTRAGTRGRAGAVVTFAGIVRGENLGRPVLRLEYEAYAPLAINAFDRIVGEIGTRWPDVVLGLHHRVGRLELGETSIVIVAASPHRADAFRACRFAIERVKQIAPIWKHEFFAGGDSWIEGATADPDDGTALGEAMKRACA